MAKTGISVHAPEEFRKKWGDQIPCSVRLCPPNYICWNLILQGDGISRGALCGVELPDAVGLCVHWQFTISPHYGRILCRALLEPQRLTPLETQNERTVSRDKLELDDTGEGDLNLEAGHLSWAWDSMNSVDKPEVLRTHNCVFDSGLDIELGTEGQQFSCPSNISLSEH